MRSCRVVAVLVSLLAVAGCAGSSAPLTEGQQVSNVCAERGIPQGTRIHRDCVEHELAYRDSVICAREVVTIGTPEHRACLRERALARGAIKRNLLQL